MGFELENKMLMKIRDFIIKRMIRCNRNDYLVNFILIVLSGIFINLYMLIPVKQRINIDCEPFFKFINYDCTPEEFVRNELFADYVLCLAVIIIFCITMFVLQNCKKKLSISQSAAIRRIVFMSVAILVTIFVFHTIGMILFLFMPVVTFMILVLSLPDNNISDVCKSGFV